MVVNKLNEFIANPIFRRIVGQGITTIDFKDVMDHGKILLVKLPGRFERMSQILGAMVIAQLLGASYERESQHKRPQFNIYADEFQRFATRDFAKLLTEASRKYNTPVTIAHQARDFLDLKNKAASLQVANLIVLRVIRKDADEIAGNFDCTPIRTKKVQKQRTKPIFKEWDETVWIENGEEQYQEALKRYELAYEAEQARLQAMLEPVQIEEEESLVLWKKTEEIPEIIVDRGNFSSFLFYPSWCRNDPASYTGKIDKAMTIPKKLSEKERLFLYSEKKVKDWQNQGWTDERIEEQIGNLVEFNQREYTDFFIFQHPPRFFDWRAPGEVSVTYNYIEREERYTLSEKTLLNIQVAFRKERAKRLQQGKTRNELKVYIIDGLRKANLPAVRETKALVLLNGELDIFERDLNKFARWVLSQGIWFIPNMKPSPCDGDHHPEVPSDADDRLVNYWNKGKITKDVVRMMTNYPLLARHPQPQIGEKRKLPGWSRHGSWQIKNTSRMDTWIQQWEKVFRERAEMRKTIYQEAQKRKWDIFYQLKEMEEKDEEIRSKIKAQYQKTEHHKEYLGEQPEVDKQTRVSHSYSEGSSHSISMSRMGGESFGTSSSRSTSYSTADVQWYDLVDELDQTPAERRDEIANELAILPDYVARVRIKDENDELVEYTLRTLAPESGLPEKAVQERIARIKETMIASKIIRPKHLIDEEISKRQQVLRQPPLEPPHKQGTLLPPEDEPPITRRG